MNYYAGIDLGGTKIYGIIINESGEILARDKIKVGENKEIESVIELIEKCYKNALDKSGLKESDIKTIGIAVPSAVNVESGILLNAPNLGWKDVKIGLMLKERLGKPVYTDNDVNMGTFGEYSFGKAKNHKNLYGIFAGTGVGGGYISGGKLERGIGFTAGEVGHLTVKIDGPRCNCGNNGCLEAIAGKIGIINYLKKKVDIKGKQTLLDAISPEWRNGIGSSALRKAIQGKDKLVIKAVNKSAIAIGIACAGIINLIGVDAIIVGGGIIEEMADIYMPIIKSTIKKYSIAGGSDNVEIIQSELGDDAVALGAAWSATRPENIKYLIK